MAVVIFGCGSKVIVDVEESCARLGLDVAAIVKNRDGLDYALATDRIVPPEDISATTLSLPYVTPFFTPAHRATASKEAIGRGFRAAATLVDPSATVARSATVGEGSYINANAVVGGAARIGAFVFINRSASVGHHAEIAEFASVGPGAILCGSVRIGRGAVIGAGAVILEEVQIGSNAVVAAGAIVTAAVAENCLVAGNPAQVIATDYRGYKGLSV